MRDFKNPPRMRGPNVSEIDYAEWNRQTWGDDPLVMTHAVEDRRDNRDPVEIGERLQRIRKIWPLLKLSEVQDRSNDFAVWPDGPEAFQQP